MTAVENEMHVTLRDITKEGVFIYASSSRTEWLTKVLGMVGLVGSQIWWTWEVEDTFRQVLSGNKYAMKELESKLTLQLNDLVAMVRDKLDSIIRKKVNTLLIIDVHARDIVDGFVRESVLNAKEFAWESQLRFYWDRDIDDCVIGGQLDSLIVQELLPIVMSMTFLYNASSSSIRGVLITRISQQTTSPISITNTGTMI